MIKIDTFEVPFSADAVFMGVTTFKRFPFAQIDTIKTLFVDADGIPQGMRTMKVTNSVGNDVEGHTTFKGKKIKVKVVMETVEIADRGIIAQMMVLKPR